MTTTLNGIAFDPGFAPYILAFGATTEYLFMDINRFKNFAQKKAKFMQYHKKFIEMFNNNIGFYIGCIMWAAYIKTQPKQKILSNHCLGQEYNEEANISDTQFMLNFANHYPKDFKYYTGKEFSIDENFVKLIKIYEEFLIINKGFVESEYNTDIVLPEKVKTNNAENFKAQIEEVLKTEDLSNLIKYLSEII